MNQVQKQPAACGDVAEQHLSHSIPSARRCLSPAHTGSCSNGWLDSHWAQAFLLRGVFLLLPAVASDRRQHLSWQSEEHMVSSSAVVTVLSKSNLQSTMHDCPHQLFMVPSAHSPICPGFLLGFCSACAACSCAGLPQPEQG
jgi:hypothetical protein